MEKIFNTISVITGIAGGIVASLFGACDEILWALAVLITLDYISGIIKAVYTKTLSSEIGIKGILKKITVLLIVALANVIQSVTGINSAIREIVIVFLIANEGISILENAAVIYPDMPQGLRDILLQLRSRDNEDRN